MRVHHVQEVINEHGAKLHEEVGRRMESRKLTEKEVLLEDPFLAGQIYAMGMLVLQLNAMSMDEQLKRESRTFTI